MQITKQYMQWHSMNTEKYMFAIHPMGQVLSFQMHGSDPDTYKVLLGFSP